MGASPPVSAKRLNRNRKLIGRMMPITVLMGSRRARRRSLTHTALITRTRCLIFPQGGPLWLRRSARPTFVLAPSVPQVSAGELQEDFLEARLLLVDAGQSGVPGHQSHYLARRVR